MSDNDYKPYGGPIFRAGRFVSLYSRRTSNIASLTGPSKTFEIRVSVLRICASVGPVSTLHGACDGSSRGSGDTGRPRTRFYRSRHHISFEHLRRFPNNAKASRHRQSVHFRITRSKFLRASFYEGCQFIGRQAGNGSVNSVRQKLDIVARPTEGGDAVFPRLLSANGRLFGLYLRRQFGISSRSAAPYLSGAASAQRLGH